MAIPKRKRDLSQFLDESGDPAGTLSVSHARDLLFDTIRHQLATSSLFSNSDHAPTIFIVYAHNNEPQGEAYDACVRNMVLWLKEINAQILSDQWTMPLHRPRIEGTGAIHNILENQVCLLPAKNDDNETRTVTSVDKVIVCGSEVLEQYYKMPSALAYIEEIVQICADGAEHSRIKACVEDECRNNKDFHHVLTELAFLEFRKSRLSGKQGMVPIMLSQKADEAPMQYLPIFDGTDVKLKLKSPTASDLHNLFFKLLEQLFPADGEFIRPFRQCYESISNMLNLQREVTRKWLTNIMSRSITDTYQTYWARFCVAVRDGKLQAYTGKLGHDVETLRQMQDVQTTHHILRWLSPISALERHGKFHNKGTSRLAATCNCIIQDKEFLQWHDSEGSALLILCGNIGTGKTYCTSRVVDWVQEGLSTNKHSEGFAYVYCNKQDNTLADPCQILRNLIRQLATGPWMGTSAGGIQTIHEKVYELWKASNEEPGIISIFSQWEECLVALINTYPRTTIVLDALDECGEVEQKALIKLSARLTYPESKYKPVKMFMSTRPEVLQNHHLDEYPVIQMQQNHQANDIAAFVRTKITDHPRWSKMTMEFQIEIVDTLLKRSGDMFLFASLQIQQLLHCDTEPDLRECLVGLPRSLEETYEGIYQQATTRGRDRKKLLDRALRWVLCAARPLTTDEFLFAISQDFEFDSLVPLRRDLDEEWMSNLCHNFLSKEKNPDDAWIFDKPFGPFPSGRRHVWRLAHQAVADFLERSHLCRSGLANYHAGTICLTIVLDTFGESPSDEKCDSHGVVDSLQCPCGQELFSQFSHDDSELETPLADYATHAWPIHLRAVEPHETRGVDRLSQTLQRFLGGAGGPSLAYRKWRQHTDSINREDVPQWSLFSKRKPPPSSPDEISLASYLGISFLLNQCLTSSSVKLETWCCAWPWIPWYEVPFTIQNQPCWSLVALACAHNETEVLERLFEKGAERKPTKKNEVPPIVAAVVADSKEAAELVLNRGTEICSSFTRRNGHVLLLAIRSGSLKTLRLLLDHIRNSSDPFETERGLSKVKISDVMSEDIIKVMLEAGVKVDMPLQNGTLLMAAIYWGWEDLVRELLERGADVNVRLENWGNNRSALYDDALEASLRHRSGTTRDELDWLAYLLINEHRANVRARHVGGACEFGRNELGQALLRHDPDLNETYTVSSQTTNSVYLTSTLIEAVKAGSEENTRLLVNHKADVNMQVGRHYNDAINAAFSEILSGFKKIYPAGSIIEALIRGGARLDQLTGDRLNIALAATVHAGLEDTAQECLQLGADPNAFCDHRYTTALGAAAGSDHPRAFDMIRILLDNGANVNAYFPIPKNNSPDLSKLALDFPLQEMLRLAVHESKINKDGNRRHDICLRSAEMLVSKGAIWDIDFAQWRRCLEKQAPEFSRQNVKSLDDLLQMLKSNRSSFFQSIPEAKLAHDQRWMIKGIEHQDRWIRSVLGLIQSILW